MDIIIAACLYLGLVGNDNAISTCEMDQNSTQIENAIDTSEFQTYYNQLSRQTLSGVIVWDTECME